MPLGNAGPRSPPSFPHAGFQSFPLHPYSILIAGCGDRQAYEVPESGAIPRGDPMVGKRWVLRILLPASSPAALTVETRVSGAPGSLLSPWT